MSFSPPEETARWYEDKVRRYGFDHRGLGFRNKSSQDRRFEAMLELGDLDGARVLDVGCGFGDLLDFLRGRGIDAEYTGLDVCAPMIDRCREKYDACQGRFICDDVLAHEPGEPYDYVIASGLFGLDSPGARERVNPTLERMLDWAEVGLAANFLSTRSPAPVENRIYVDPCKALEAAMKLTPAARVNHAYLPNDFTLYLYKTPAWDGETARSA